ncbi:3-isopropylmalate dehydrogenase [Sphingobium chlorophenolicum L-1]|uniref:3-isopropylmalate dehydrogenase n=1 Tax=Sphingobium chlorophenolicum L-1 TaxID=690566 RepID=F6F393_SPHCR|nr:3-isopropylmalate dehydrogenase [Sphingobium chlorophenolicum]AEG50905.1 3-isopropylmalate dehydrogenase [Sphingobium chlorophenolicum L-1]
MAKKILLLPGDGIGPEVTAVSRRLIDFLATEGIVELQVDEAPFGGAAYDLHGAPITAATIETALQSDAVLMGAVGGPQWSGLAYDLRPEAGLLKLREAMDVYANLRPAFCFNALAGLSSLKTELIAGLDILFVRELVGGVYFGQPRGIETLPNGEKRGLNTHSYTSSEIRRVARVAFDIARTRGNRVCSVEKGNVMEAGLLWREVVTELHAEEYADVELSHMLADNCAMQLVRAPQQFDVILTDNLFGDILSDIASMLTGSIGMLPSAAIGKPGAPGLYEPIHGSAPDIAGKGIANPCASVLSLAMAMRYSLERPDIAIAIEQAVGAILTDGQLTADLGGSASTQDIADTLLEALGRELAREKREGFTPNNGK